LINSINGLLANLDYALKKERRFTDFAAHELRTPIAIFKTQAETALKATDDSERRVILEAQVQAANRATNMVDQLLTLARLEHADIPTEKLSLSEIAQEVVEERSPLAEEKQIDLRFEQQASAFIHGNKELLTIILSNLIDNAIKYTHEHGRVTVTVSVSMQDQTAILLVCDTGPGIPEDKLPFVTERFYRVSGHKQPGAGLGLTIVKRASEIMGAILILRNTSKGKGLESILQFLDSTFAS
jgi:signal transduction histidine kinase